jgi:hypothetical protein
MVTNNFHCKKLQKFTQDGNCPVVYTGKQPDCCMSNIICLNWKHGGIDCMYEIFFCPFDGEELEQAFILKLRRKLSNNDVKTAYMDDFRFETDIPESLQHLKRRDWFDQELEYDNIIHNNGGICGALLYSVEDDIPITYVPHLRMYGILKKCDFEGEYWLQKMKAEYCEIEPMDYCPFCGAKFPERLDGELTEILRNEYNLGSWKDYKKAPHEFHTDEWWRKRGL